MDEERRRTLVDDADGTSLRGTMNVLRNVGYVVPEVEKIGSRRAPGAPSSAGANTEETPQHRVVEKSDNSDRSGSQQGGSGDLDHEGAAPRSVARGTSPESAAATVMDEGGRRLRTVQQDTAAQRALAQKVLAARMEAEPGIERKTEVAVKHASSVIGTILKKTYGDERLREKDAAKFVALILRANGFYTYEHCTRMIDLATDLADRVGHGDPEMRRRISDGIVFKDIGEVEFLVSRGSPRQKEALANFVAGVDIAQAGLLHDIGKIKVPKEILYKPGMLTPEEAKIMQMHPIYGAEILESIPPLRHAAPAARYHHERYDGKGYPYKLAGEDIPLEARIIAIVDTFDAMAADRPYRKGLPLDVCRSELWKGRGKQFDPLLVEAFMDILDERFVRGSLSMEDYSLPKDA